MQGRLAGLAWARPPPLLWGLLDSRGVCLPRERCGGGLGFRGCVGDGDREPFVVTGARLVVSLFGQGQRGAPLAPCSWRGGEGEGAGRGWAGKVCWWLSQPRVPWHRAGDGSCPAGTVPRSIQTQGGHSLGSRGSLWGCRRWQGAELS